MQTWDVESGPETTKATNRLYRHLRIHVIAGIKFHCWLVNLKNTWVLSANSCLYWSIQRRSNQPAFAIYHTSLDIDNSGSNQLQFKAQWHQANCSRKLTKWSPSGGCSSARMKLNTGGVLPRCRESIFTSFCHNIEWLCEQHRNTSELPLKRQTVRRIHCEGRKPLWFFRFTD